MNALFIKVLLAAESQGSKQLQALGFAPSKGACQFDASTKFAGLLSSCVASGCLSLCFRGTFCKGSRKAAGLLHSLVRMIPSAGCQK